jgi:hypothetical protein
MADRNGRSIVASPTLAWEFFYEFAKIISLRRLSIFTVSRRFIRQFANMACGHSANRRFNSG